MIHARLCLVTLAVLAAGLFPSAVHAQSAPVRDKNVEAQLISSHSTVAPGEPFTLALRLEIDPTWHTYWINPGETGKPTTLELELPEGFEAGELQFPLPKKFVTDFGFNFVEAGYGYESEVIHPIKVTPPENLKAGDSFTLSGQASWLMCDPNTCVPGSVALSITLQVGEAATPSPNSAAIEDAVSKLPADSDWPMSVTLEGSELAFSVDIPADAIPGDATLAFFPYQSGVLDPLADAEFEIDDNALTVAVPKHEALTEAPESFSALLVTETATGRTGYRVSTGTSPASATEGVDPAAAADVEASPAEIDKEALPFGGGLLGILFAAFLGGIILNVMPCVFPVISLKVMSFVGQAGEDRRKVLAHSIVFALGILVFFWILTAVLLVLRATGSTDVGWGVQLRQPEFVILLIFVMVVVAMSLFGVFEIGARMTSVGGGLAAKSGYAGSFWSGALAVLLATPCTAPLMAPAIGFALVQPAPVMILVFTFLGLGLAAPYFIFAIFPKLLDAIPPPGPWMETFKQFMAFPMLAVAVWLIGVLSKQLDVSGLQWALAATLLVALAGWFMGRFGAYTRPRPTRRKARLAAAAIFAGAFFLAMDAAEKRAAPNVVNINDVIAQHRGDGKNVFVDFTAEWCITCKANERIAIKSNVVQQAFEDNNIEFVIADWTNPDPHIGGLLEKHGRAGVPFYLLYPADQSKPAIPIKEGIITPDDVLDAIRKLPDQSTDSN
ncbi:MAG: thioredoxin family protein [Verrucomicrobiales bacterium]